MRYKLNCRANPHNRSQKKLYAVPVNNGIITESDLKKEIVVISPFSQGEVANLIIDGVTEIIPKYLLRKKSVCRGDNATLRISFNSESVENSTDFNVGMIDGKKILFTPSTEFKR
jgi:hypothetical protein